MKQNKAANLLPLVKNKEQKNVVEDKNTLLAALLNKKIKGKVN